MTANHARKNAVRQRVAETGGTYTAAARAIAARRHRIRHRALPATGQTAPTVAVSGGASSAARRKAPCPSSM